MNTDSPQNCQKHSDHSHRHSSAKEFFQFFSCCLGEDPAPISDKIQNLRAQLPENSMEEVKYTPGTNFQVLPDMVVGDLLTTFSQIRPYLEELHPLGLLSPALNATSLEMFLIDFDLDLQTVCQELESLINQS